MEQWSEAARETPCPCEPPLASGCRRNPEIWPLGEPPATSLVLQILLNFQQFLAQYLGL